MPNTKSAERRMRNSERKHQANSRCKSRLHTLDTQFRQLLAEGKKDEAKKLLCGLSSALDKAAKVGVIPAATANRKKSRLSLALGKSA